MGAELDYSEIYNAVIKKPFVPGFDKNGEAVLDRRHQAYLEDIRHCDSFLEIGARDGKSSLYLASLGNDVTCIDIKWDPRELISFCEQSKIDISYIEGDFLSYEFDKKFDCVFAAEVIEHIDDWSAFLKKMISLSSKYVVVTTPVGRSFFDPGHVNFFKEDDFYYLSEYGGLRIERLYTKESDKKSGQQCFYIILSRN